MDPFIIQPIEQSLGTVPKHEDVDGLTRWLLLGKAIDERSPLNVALHVVDKRVAEVTGPGGHYAEVDIHECDEINILWSLDESLKYRFELNGQIIDVSAPASIVIPAGVRHRAEAIEGSGIFLCIKLPPKLG